jgi:L-alanine-DL-glutamate epimerase-like enolase superfamily enzyme
MRGAITVAGLYGESALGSLSALQLEATRGPRDLPAELSHHLQLEERVATLPRIEGGEAQLPSSAGLSELVDWERVQRLAIH